MIASKFEEMRRRIDDMDKIVPGARASTEVFVDDVPYTLTLQRKK